jgi:hypothetical protein
MDAKVLGLLGTALSALIAAIGYYTKTKHERRRATRTVLYYLLELHHLPSRIQFGVKRFPAEYAERCKAALNGRGLPFTDVEATVLGTAIEQLVRHMALSELDQLSTELTDPFTRALADLSKEDPLLAFQLKGKESISTASKSVRSLVANLTKDDPSESSRFATDAILADLDDFARTVAVKELAGSIRAVAWRCGFITLVRCHFLLRRTSRMSLVSTLDKQLSPVIEGIVLRAIEAQNASLTPSLVASRENTSLEQ